jgi:hypothetical protein
VYVFIESAAFDRVRASYLDDDEYSELQEFMMQNPDSGAIIRGSGGVRKLAGGAKARGSAAGCG